MTGSTERRRPGHLGAVVALTVAMAGAAAVSAEAQCPQATNCVYVSPSGAASLNFTNAAGANLDPISVKGGQNIQWVFQNFPNKQHHWVTRLSFAGCAVSNKPPMGMPQMSGTVDQWMPASASTVNQSAVDDTCTYTALAYDSDINGAVFSRDPTIIVGKGQQPKNGLQILLYVAAGLACFLVGGFAGFKLKSWMS